MMFIGFGFLMTFLHKYGFSAVSGLAFLSTSSQGQVAFSNVSVTVSSGWLQFSSHSLHNPGFWFAWIFGSFFDRNH